MKNKGITLIALIVTVILMIILASVSIKLITDGGIIDKTRKTSINYQYEADREEFELAKAGAKNYFTDEIDEEQMEGILEDWTYEGKLWISPHGNEFILELETSEEEEEPEEAPDLLKKYILGEELTGRNIMEIIGENYEFKDEESTIPNASKEIKFKGMYILGKFEQYVTVIGYDSKYYKFILDTGEMKTIGEYGVIEFYKNDSTSKVGKKVNYDGKNWIIIYDDKTNGLQMISENVLLYKGEKVRLGKEDTYLNEKGELEGTTNIEKAIDSYNKVVSTLNRICTEIVNTTPRYIKDVRCVGSNPINKNSESTENKKSDFLLNYPIREEGKYYDVGKDTDLNLASDYERLAVVEKIKAAINGEFSEEDGNLYGDGYWLASRMSLDDLDEEIVCCYFSIRAVAGDGISEGNKSWEVEKNSAHDGDETYSGLRPVIILDASECNLIWDESNKYYTITEK